jgi:hypothetical protein
MKDMGFLEDLVDKVLCKESGRAGQEELSWEGGFFYLAVS